MRKGIVALIMAAALAPAAPAAAQEPPQGPCNAGTMNAHERVPHQNQGTEQAHASIPHC